MLELRECGVTYRELAEMAGVTVERARQIVSAEEEKVKRERVQRGISRERHLLKIEYNVRACQEYWLELPTEHV